jgi:predicted nuclease of predicted toxin-antitoxin system
MPLRIKLDEDLSETVGAPFHEAGHSVLTVAGQGWSGMKDPELWPRVIAEGVFFVTADKGFSDIRAYRPGTHPGILILRPDRESIVEYRALTSQVVAKHELESLSGTITVATPRSVRVRRSPMDI